MIQRQMSIYIFIKEGEVEDAIEVDEDVFLEYGANKEIIGIEIWQARKNIFPQLIEYLKDLKQTIPV